MIEILVSRPVFLLINKKQSAIEYVRHDCLEILRVAFAVFWFYASVPIRLRVDRIRGFSGHKKFPGSNEKRERVILLLQLHLFIALLILFSKGFHKHLPCLKIVLFR